MGSATNFNVATILSRKIYQVKLCQRMDRVKMWGALHTSTLSKKSLWWEFFSSLENKISLHHTVPVDSSPPPCTSDCNSHSSFYNRENTRASFSCISGTGFLKLQRCRNYVEFLNASEICPTSPVAIEIKQRLFYHVPNRSWEKTSESKHNLSRKDSRI